MPARIVTGMICVDAERVGVAQPDKVLFEDLSVTISSGDRVAVVGINGSGKSTLLRLLTGAASPDDGTVRFGRGVRIASLDQDPRLPPAPSPSTWGGPRVAVAKEAWHGR